MTAAIHPKGRATIHEELDGLRITIPARRDLFTLGFLAFWLCGWALFEGFVSAVLITQRPPLQERIFLITWLALWTFFGLAALASFAWISNGREIIFCDDEAILIRRQCGRLHVSKAYDLNGIRNLRVEPAGALKPDELDFPDGRRGLMAFDAGAATVRCGVAIDAAEAKELVRAIKRKFAIPDNKG